MTMRLLTLISFVLTFGLLAAGGADSKMPSTPAQVTAATTDLTAPLIETPLAERSEIFLRIIKMPTPNSQPGRNTGTLEAFVRSGSGEFTPYKIWPICTYSGRLGPKLKQGDRQSPEGFYFVNKSRLNPNSRYHLRFNLGYPNAYDRAHGRTGDFLMVHGDCVSIGCYAMTDKSIEEIYALVEGALDSGQSFVRVHAFPFPMTDENLAATRGNSNYEFWSNLKLGWDWFETHGAPPDVNVQNKRYVFSEAD